MVPIENTLGEDKEKKQTFHLAGNVNPDAAAKFEHILYFSSYQWPSRPHSKHSLSPALGFPLLLACYIYKHDS